MNAMKQKKIIIKLRDFTDDDHPFGNKQGRETYGKLLDFIDEHPTTNVFGMSLKGIEATDASFPRESVISLAKSKRGEVGFYLTGFATKDLIDNWDYAAKAKEQSIIILLENGYDLIGPGLNSGQRELLDFIMNEGVVTTSKVADKFDVSAQNASGRLKKLHVLGLIMGAKEVAESGGMEFIYRAIK